MRPPQRESPCGTTTETRFRGDVTAHFYLWDAGTEVDEEPGVGIHQPSRGSGGTDENGVVEMVDSTYTFPSVAENIRVTITHEAPVRFTVMVEDLRPLLTGGLRNHISPGVWGIHHGGQPFFVEGEEDLGIGMEALAETGSTTAFVRHLTNGTGVNVVLSPGAWVVHDEGNPLFDEGSVDRGNGLERIAEDSSPTELVRWLTTQTVSTGGAFSIPDGGDGPAVVPKGGSYSFTVLARSGAYLSLASMFVQSNDWFYAPGPGGIALWDESGVPISGDVTEEFALWEAGTEENQPPGAGLDQAPRQSAPNTGTEESLPIARVSAIPGYLPDVADAIRVRVMPIETVPFTVQVKNVFSDGAFTTSTGAGGSPTALPGRLGGARHR